MTIKELKEVELIHPGGLREVMPVESIQPTFISVRWRMSGIYDIHLKQNVMIARNLASRRKGPCYWKLAEIEKIRKMVWDYFNPEPADFEESIKRHEEDMMRGKVLKR